MAQSPAPNNPGSPAAIFSPVRRSYLLLAFSFGLAAILLYLTLKDVNWQSFWVSIRTGNYGYLFLTIPIASVNYFIRAMRWSIFVRSEKKVPIISVFWANMVGYMGNAYMPARAGELLRSGFLGVRTGLGASFVLATALAERLLDVVALVLIGSIALLLQPGISSFFENTIRVTALVGMAGLILLIALPFQEKLILSLLSRMPLSEKWTKLVVEQVTRFLVGMRSLQSWRRMGGFILLTVVIWLVDAVANTIGVHIINKSLGIDQALILLAALGLSSAVPSTPGYLGVYQFVAVIVLAPFGFSRSEALAYILISQVISYVIVSFWGLLGLWQINRGTGIPGLAE